MEKKRYKIKEKTDTIDILSGKMSYNTQRGALNVTGTPKLDSISELDSYPELTKAETLDFAEGTDSVQ